MSFPIAYVLKNKDILVVGGGAVAETRVVKLAPTGARLTVIAPEVTPAIADLVASNDQIQHINRAFIESDLEMKHWTWVLTALDDHEVSKWIGNECRRTRIPVNVADVPPLCDFYFGSNYHTPNLSILVSTGSAAPRLSKRVLNELVAFSKKKQYTKAIANVQECRMALREYLPGKDPKTIQARMLVMKTLCDKSTWSELASMSKIETKAMVKGMVLSMDACPAHPIAELGYASDFVATSQGEDESDTTESSESSSSDSSDSSDSSSDSDSSSGSSSSNNSDSDSDSSDFPISGPGSKNPGSAKIRDPARARKGCPAYKPSKSERKRTANQKEEPAKRKSGSECIIRSVECYPGGPEPPVPPFPYVDLDDHWSK